MSAESNQHPCKAIETMPLNSNELLKNQEEDNAAKYDNGATASALSSPQRFKKRSVTCSNVEHFRSKSLKDNSVQLAHKKIVAEEINMEIRKATCKLSEEEYSMIAKLVGPGH